MWLQRSMLVNIARYGILIAKGVYIFHIALVHTALANEHVILSNESANKSDGYIIASNHARDTLIRIAQGSSLTSSLDSVGNGVSSVESPIYVLQGLAEKSDNSQVISNNSDNNRTKLSTTDEEIEDVNDINKLIEKLGGKDNASRLQNGALNLAPTFLQTDLLQELDPTFVGILQESNGGFSFDLWKGLTPSTFIQMIDNTPHIAKRSWVNAMLRRMMVTQAVLPNDIDHQEQQVDLRDKLFFGKVQWLINAGFYDDAKQLLAELPPALRFQKYYELIIQIAIYTQPLDKVCDIVRTIEQADDMLKLVCSIITGHHAQAQLQMEFIREEQEITPTTQTLLDMAFGIATTKNVYTASDVLEEHLLVRYLNLEKELTIAFNDPAFVLLALAQDDDVEPMIRAQAIEWLAIRGVISIQTAGEWLSQDVFLLPVISQDKQSNALKPLHRAREWSFVMHELERGQIQVTQLLKLINSNDLLLFYSKMLVHWAEKMQFQPDSKNDKQEQLFKMAELAAIAGRPDVIARWLPELFDITLLGQLMPWLVLYNLQDGQKLIKGQQIIDSIPAGMLGLLSIFNPSLIDLSYLEIEKARVVLKRSFSASILFDYQKAIFSQAKGHALLLLAQMSAMTDWRNFSYVELVHIASGLMRVAEQELSIEIARDMLLDLGELDTKGKLR